MTDDALPAFELDDVELVSATHPLDAVAPRPNSGHLWSTQDDLRFDIVLASKRTQVVSCPLLQIRDIKVGEWARSGRLRKLGRREEPTATGGLAIVTNAGEIQFRVPLGEDELRRRVAPLVEAVRIRRTLGGEDAQP